MKAAKNCWDLIETSNEDDHEAKVERAYVKVGLIVLSWLIALAAIWEAFACRS